MYLEEEKRIAGLNNLEKKKIPIGRGGAILTNDKKAYQWLKMARYDGRDIRKNC